MKKGTTVKMNEFIVPENFKDIVGIKPEIVNYQQLLNAQLQKMLGF